MENVPLTNDDLLIDNIFILCYVFAWVMVFYYESNYMIVLACALKLWMSEVGFDAALMPLVTDCIFDKCIFKSLTLENTLSKYFFWICECLMCPNAAPMPLVTDWTGFLSVKSSQ